MERFIIVFFLTGTLAFAQVKSETSTVKSDPRQAHIESHEKMAKLHQEAALCLKSGENEDVCRSSFREASEDEVCHRDPKVFRKMMKKNR